MPKLSDIANITGLSISTVSRALQDSYEIGDETKAAVKKVAVQLGYRAKKSRIGKTVGLIVPDIQCNYYTEMVSQIQKEFEKKDYFMIMAISGFSINGIVDAMNKLITQDICGIIVTDCFCLEGPEEFAMHEEIAKCPVPVTLISQNNYFLPVDTIKLDELYGMKLLIDHLVSRGHRKIGYVGEYASDIRYHNFQKTMAEAGLTIDEKYVKRGKERAELGGYLRTKEIIAEMEGDDAPATAIVICYDQYAIGVLNAISESNKTVPEDISLVSFDDIIMNNYLSVPLTSISFPTEELCRLTVKILLNHIKDPEGHINQSVSLQPTIMERVSTRKL